MILEQLFYFVGAKPMSEWKTYTIQSGYSFYNIRAKNKKEAKHTFKKNHNKVIDNIEVKHN